MMKLAIVCIALIAAVIFIVDLEDDDFWTSIFPKVSGQVTTTEDLLMAQNELSIGHEFSETLLQVNRNIISSYITIVNTALVDSFMDTYGELHIIAELVFCFLNSTQN